ncbi:MAG: hypothetical protein MI920_15015 [Kiloniellales bacterium]|nr:hypothetical protein [Kiloniellales bacterium]
MAFQDHGRAEALKRRDKAARPDRVPEALLAVEQQGFAPEGLALPGRCVVGRGRVRPDPVDYLREGGYIYDLQQNLGHTSIKTTKIYLDYLTPAEAKISKGVAQKPSQWRRFDGPARARSQADVC